MQFRRIRLRFRRSLRKSQQQVEEFGTQAEKNLDRHFFKRYERLLPVRRFIAGWLALVLLLITGLIAQNVLLSGYYQTLRPVPGGIYNEGVLGTFTNANPLYATTDVDTTVSRLIFASLFTYDKHGQLTGELAQSYSPDEHGSTYTVHLKPGLKWQDGAPLTSADVVFTYQLIQNPDAQSPLLHSWQGITVSAPDAQTVVFKLPDPLASFPHNLVNGIVPQHLLAKIPAVDMRATDFNTTNPVGSGPFAWQAIQVTGGDPSTAQEQIALKPFPAYANGRPKLQQFIVHAYAAQKQLVAAFKTGQLTGAEGLSSLPPELSTLPTADVHNLLQRAATMVFFKTSTGVLADVQVRSALVGAADVPAIIKNLSYATHAVREPFLSGQLGYDPSLVQAGFDLKAAQKTLDADGWLVGAHGIRAKNGQPLTFTLSAAQTPEYVQVAHQLAAQWKRLNVDVHLQLQDAADFQTTLSYHGYDAVLYGISIGNDPDVFVYWDSSQADIRSPNRLNLSEYKNSTADTSLEAGRTRLDPGLRALKYKPFLQAWRQDNPALGLYQPRLLYLTNGQVAGLTEQPITSATDRFENIQNWEIRQAKVTN